MNTPREAVLFSARGRRRRPPRRPRVVQCEHLETRCLLDAGAASDLAAPATFTSKAEFEQFLIDSAVAQAKPVLGTTYPASGYGGYGGWIPTGAPTAAPVAVVTAAPTPTSAPGHSTTNNQVQGVDEGDIV